MTTGNKYSEYIYNGIDRVDNAVGYILENCIPCCEFCNKAKGTKTYFDFLDWICRLIAYKKKENE